MEATMTLLEKLHHEHLERRKRLFTSSPLAKPIAIVIHQESVQKPVPKLEVPVIWPVRFRGNIIRTVAEAYGIDPDVIWDRRRFKRICEPRWVVWHIMALYFSYSQIGRVFNYDHTTVMNGIMRIRERIAQDVALADQVEAIVQKVLKQ